MSVYGCVVYFILLFVNRGGKQNTRGGGEAPLDPDYIFYIHLYVTVIDQLAIIFLSATANRTLTLENATQHILSSSYKIAKVIAKH